MKLEIRKQVQGKNYVHLRLFLLFKILAPHHHPTIKLSSHCLPHPYICGYTAKLGVQVWYLNFKNCYNPLHVKRNLERRSYQIRTAFLFKEGKQKSQFLIMIHSGQTRRVPTRPSGPEEHSQVPLSQDRLRVHSTVAPPCGLGVQLVTLLRLVKGAL